MAVRLLCRQASSRYFWHEGCQAFTRRHGMSLGPVFHYPSWPHQEPRILRSRCRARSAWPVVLGKASDHFLSRPLPVLSVLPVRSIGTVQLWKMPPSSPLLRPVCRYRFRAPVNLPHVANRQIRPDEIDVIALPTPRHTILPSSVLVHSAQVRSDVCIVRLSTVANSHNPDQSSPGRPGNFSIDLIRVQYYA